MSGPGNPITSGDAYGFNEVATNIITEAYRICGVINEIETPSAGQFQTGMVALNSMVKEWEASGIHVWTEQEAVLFLQQNQYRYLLGNNSPDHCCDAFSYTQAQISSSAALGANSVTINLSPGVLVGDNFGVVLDTGTAFWTTVKTVTSTATTTTVTFPTGVTLPFSASQQNFCFDYTTNIIRPLRIPAGRRLQYQGNILTPLTKMMSRQEYMDLPQPQNPGTVTQAFYNPGLNQGELFVWNNPNSATQGLRFTWFRPIDSFDTTDDAADLPQEWTNAMNWNLAMELCPRYSVPAARWDRISVMAQNKLQLVQGFDREFTSVYFGLSFDSAARY